MLVIGNGESRKNIDINEIHGVKVGCNAIFRDYNNINHIICVDKRMVNEALKANANSNSTFIYTRKEWIDRYHKKEHIRLVPKLPYKGDQRADDPFQWGSGPYAVLLAAKHDIEVKMIGFDLYSKTNTTNNIYKDTDNYNTSNKRAVDPRYWIHQIAKVFEHYSNTTFLIYNDDLILPDTWKLPNVILDKIDNL
jgi:hypothetical protein